MSEVFVRLVGPFREEVSRRRGFVLLAVVLGVQLCVYAAWQIVGFKPASLSRQVVGDLFFVPISALAVWSAWRASRRCSAGSRLRRAWLLIALGWAAWAAGNAAQTVYEALGMAAFPSVADVFYLSFIPLTFAGLMSFPTAARDRRERLRYLLDLAVVTLAGTAAIFYLVLSDAATSHASGLLKAVSVAYPVGDVVILFGVASALLRGTVPSARRALLLLGVTFGVYVVSDCIYGYLSVHSSYTGGDLVDCFYMAAVSLFVLAAAAQETAAKTERVVSSNERANGLLLAATTVGVVTLVSAERHDVVFPAYVIVILIAAMTGTALLRQFLGRRDLARALAAEQAARAEVEAGQRLLVVQVERLKEADRIKDELISIVGYLELLREDLGSLSAEQNGFFDAIGRNSERLHSLMEDLLLISRAEAGRLTVQKETIDLRELVTQCLDGVRPCAEDKGLQLLLDAYGPAEVTGDANLFAEMLDNLVSNAIKFTEHGQVTIALGTRGDRVLLSVADTGPGIAAADQSYVFDRFFRAPSMQGIPGTGLGLSIVKAIVEAHAGTIHMHSEQGAGTTFSVELPAPTAAHAQPALVKLEQAA